MIRTAILLVFAALFVGCFAARFSDCGSVTGHVNSVQVTGCSNREEVCKLKRGTHVDVKVGFTSRADSTSLTSVADALIQDVTFPLPSAEPDACKTGVTCPVKNGRHYTYQNTLEIKDSYPEVAFTMRFQLKDSKNNDMVCLMVKCQIV